MVFYLLAKNPLLFPRSFSDLRQSKLQYYIWFGATQQNSPKQFCTNSRKMGKVLSPMVYIAESDAMCSKTLILPTGFFLPTVKIKKIHFSFGKFNKLSGLGWAAKTQFICLRDKIQRRHSAQEEPVNFIKAKTVYSSRNLIKKPKKAQNWTTNNQPPQKTQTKKKLWTVLTICELESDLKLVLPYQTDKLR